MTTPTMLRSRAFCSSHCRIVEVFVEVVVANEVVAVVVKAVVVVEIVAVVGHAIVAVVVSVVFVVRCFVVVVVEKSTLMKITLWSRVEGGRRGGRGGGGGGGSGGEVRRVSVAVGQEVVGGVRRR